MMNWSEYEAEPVRRRPIILPLFIWLGIILSTIAILVGLSGCATVSPSPRSEPRQEVCLMQLLGHADGGVPVVAATCVSPEEFAKAQK